MRQRKRQESNAGQDRGNAAAVAPQPDPHAGEPEHGEHRPAKRARAGGGGDRVAGDQARGGNWSGGKVASHRVDYGVPRASAC